MKRLLFTILILLSFYIAVAQIDSNEVRTKPKISTKKGWQFGLALPVIAFDSDVGFKGGLLTYFYDYGDGTVYPNYLKSLYLEYSRTTKGSGINCIEYKDYKFLGTDIRFSGFAYHYIEQALDFYGFNGYEAEYNADYENVDSDIYKSRMYYRHDRRLWKFVTDFQKPIYDNKLRVLAGLSFFSFDIKSVDIAKLNKGKADNDKLPTTDAVPGLYEQYVKMGIIKDAEKNGGNITHLKTALIWDTRDFEAFPVKGMWTEALFIYSMPILGNKKGYLQANFTHRQYFNLYKKRIVLAYRVFAGSKLAGEMPFFMLPFYQNSNDIRDGLGGGKTIRGVMRNRVVGEGTAFENTELRCKILEKRIGKLDFYIALSGFFDAGIVIQKYDFTTNTATSYKRHQNESIHGGYGGGIRFGFNHNSIVAVDYGRALNKNDGDSGLYINLGWLF